MGQVWFPIQCWSTKARHWHRNEVFMAQAYCLQSGNVGWLSQESRLSFTFLIFHLYLSVSFWIFVLNIMVKTGQTKENKYNHIRKTMLLVLSWPCLHWVKQRSSYAPQPLRGSLHFCSISQFGLAYKKQCSQETKWGSHPDLVINQPCDLGQVTLAL